MRPVALDEPALRRWGRDLGASAARGRTFVALYGPLGAGKTTLVQAACLGAGVSDAVTSPTYTLVHEYSGAEGPVAHVDLYRISGPAELPALGWEDLTAGKGAVFVEWAERAGDELPADRWDVRLSIPPGGAERWVEVAVSGAAPPPPPPEAETC